jgi:Rps23 Pro-64 3,4-dihydroxylase Tpa1-like proline 4-hydroxylase
MTYSDPLIWTKNKTLSSDFCNSVIDKFENDQRKGQGQVGYGRQVFTQIKKSIDLNISFYKDWKNEDIIFFNSLSEGFANYMEHCNQCNQYFPNAFFGSNLTNTMSESTQDSGYQIQKTEPGGYYKWHNDALLENNFLRVITYIWYLNDVTDGGYTEFSNGMKIQPEQGKMLIFPSTWTYLHQGFPPKSETKYICTGWISYQMLLNTIN